MSELLKQIPHLEELQDLQEEFQDAQMDKSYTTIQERKNSCNKIVPSLEEAIRRSGLRDGMTVSFHGDYIVNMVMDKLAEMGFHDLVLAASSLSDCHAPLIRHIQNGVIRRIETSGLRGKLADAISSGLMDVPVVFRSHGGRHRDRKAEDRCGVFGSAFLRSLRQCQRLQPGYGNRRHVRFHGLCQVRRPVC